MHESRESVASLVPEAMVDRLAASLWSRDAIHRAPSVFMLLDAARDERVLPLLRRSRLDYRCLFLGELAPELARVAPYLVHLGRRSLATREILRLGWGQSWGVFLHSDRILQDLRRHFRRFLQVKDESGKRFFFRYYDPRVLRAYLPTCEKNELDYVFGPVQMYLVEGESINTILEFRFQDEALLRRRIQWETV